MDTGDQQINDRQSYIGLAIVFIVLLVFMWWYSSYQADHPEAESNAVVSPGQSELKVVPSSGSPTSTGNPQQTSNPSENTSTNVQSGQPNLQPAGTPTQTQKQELGL